MMTFIVYLALKMSKNHSHFGELGAIGCESNKYFRANFTKQLTLEVLVATIDAQWEGMGDVGPARYEPALLPPCPTIRV